MSITQSPVVELRQYVLKPGAADALVEVFEAEFVESQEALGMAIGGLFLDRDDADRFVWMRGFSSMEARRDALGAFYGGPVWKQHGPAANATMVDSDDVLLLRPTDPPHPALEPGPRAPVGAAATGDEWVVVTAWLHEPGHGTCSWLARVRAAAVGLGPRDDGRHVAHRARREHLPRAPGPPRPRVRLGGHLRRPRVVRSRPHRPRPRTPPGPAP